MKSWAKNAVFFCFAGIEVRLTTGQISYVEVRSQGKWRRLCNTSWTSENAGVVCRQLGFSKAKFSSVAISGNRTEHIWLNDLRCVGNETEISLCESHNWDGGDTCSSGREVTLECTEGMELCVNRLEEESCGLTYCLKH